MAIGAKDILYLDRQGTVSCRVRKEGTANTRQIARVALVSRSHLAHQ